MSIEAQATAMLELLAAAQHRIVEYPSHTTEFAEGWFAAVELSRAACESTAKVWELLPPNGQALPTRMSNRLFAQYDLVHHLAVDGKLEGDYANGFGEFCQMAATEIHRATDR